MKNFWNVLKDWKIDFIYGLVFGSTNVVVQDIIKETIHIAGVVFAAGLSAIVVHFIRKALDKKK